MFAAFKQTEGYQEILRMLAKLREQGPAAFQTAEPTRVITVRLPKSLHESLRDEAYEHHTSMNQLCISKLLQFIDGQQMPPEG
jgi:predicted HicB family RNase H-like nuclease